jgi:orotate phosphoribosyltransferase
MSGTLSKEGVKFDRIAGVLLGSIPLAVALSLETKIPFVMVRKEKKNHGTGKLVEGILVKGEKVLVVEDVITSAGSVSEAISTLRNEGVVVETVLAVVDRQEGGREKLEDMNVRLLSLLTARDLLGA